MENLGVRKGKINKEKHQDKKDDENFIPTKQMNQRNTVDREKIRTFSKSYTIEERYSEDSYPISYILVKNKKNETCLAKFYENRFVNSLKISLDILQVKQCFTKI